MIRFGDHPQPRPRRSTSRRRAARRRDLCEIIGAFAQSVIDNLARVGYLVLRALALVCAALLLSLSSDQSTEMLLLGGASLVGLFWLFWRAADALVDLDDRRRWGRRSTTVGATMTPTQSVYLASLMARHGEVSGRLAVTYPDHIDPVVAEWCAVSRELVALRREIQATERSTRTR